MSIAARLAATFPSASSARATDALQTMANEDEEGIINDNNVFASLMPNLFSRLQHCNDTVSEQEFQEIHRLLNLAKSDDDVIKGNLSMNQPLIPFLKQREKDNELAKKKPSPLIKSDYASGKENAMPTKLPQRNKLSRRERSSRVTTHRKPFVVDVRNFGSILNNNALGKCKKPQDVHAFWEAADEREASEAIMCKLRGSIEQKSGNGETTLRRIGVRRKNSQRTTTRLRRFAVELPACAEQVQSLDEEQLEEEDATEESSFTFLSNPDFRAQNHLFELSNAEKYTKTSQLVSSVQSADKYVEIVDLDGMAKLSCQEADDNDILSDGKSPLVNSNGTGQCSFGLEDVAASKDGSGECEKPSQVPDILRDAPSHQAVEPISSPAADLQDKNSAGDIHTGNELEMKATPYNRNVASKRTPFTSPTPPSNPLAAFGLRKDNVVEDISKRRLDFDDNNMNFTTSELDLLAPTTQISPVSQNPSASPEVPQPQVEVYSQDISKRRLDFDDNSTNSTTLELDLSTPITQISPFLQNPSASPEVPQAQIEVTSPADCMLVHEENLELAEEVNTKRPDVVLPTIATKSPQWNATKPLTKVIPTRKKSMNDRRHSLTGAGTNWNEGQRRSTRIRSRPLEWWRGERFLRGRVHKSLATVIGIKYSSPPPCWPKRGTKAPKFKVESYVSEEYAKYVEFAALY